MLRKKHQTESDVPQKAAIAVLSAPIGIVIHLAAQFLALLLSGYEGLFPGTDVFQSILSTCSEIIAGLYGTTLAGYTFFLSRLDGLMASDVTLDYVASSVKNRFRYLIWYITFNVLVTLFISILLMYLPVPSGDEVSYFYRLFCNEFVLFLAFSIVLILRYAILVINPNCLEKEAAKLKKRISRKGISGSAVEFIALYNRIETACNQLLPAAVLDQIHENKGRRFEYTIDLLYEQKLLAVSLVRDLTRIHRYYECVINCMPLSVTEEMCVLAHQVLACLEHIHCRLTAGNCCDFGSCSAEK